MSALEKKQEQPQINTSGEGLLAVIQSVAANPDINIDRLDALLKMRADEEERQRRIDREDREDAARRAFLGAMAEVQAEIGPIMRTRKNTFNKSTYADLADIDAVVTPILTKHGFSTSSVPIPCDVDGCIRMRLTLSHKDGHERDYEDDFPLDAAGSQGNANKTGIQARGSSQTYARRYLKCSALDLAFIDDNDGVRKPQSKPVETITEEQLITLTEYIDQLENKAGFYSWLRGIPHRCTSIENLPASSYDDILAMLKKKVNK